MVTDGTPRSEEVTENEMRNQQLADPDASAAESSQQEDREDPEPVEMDGGPQPAHPVAGPAGMIGESQPALAVPVPGSDERRAPAGTDHGR